MDLLNIIGNMLCLILHITDTDSFPKALTKEQENKYIKEMESGDENAKRMLIEHNMRLIVHIAKKYSSNFSEQDDLISIGTMGLIKGVNSYNSQRGTRLASYCARCIENEILMHLRNTKKLNLETSISEPIDTDNEGNPLTLMDIIPLEFDIVEEIDTTEKLKKLNELLLKMPESRNKTILYKRYGLDGQKPLTQKEIAKELKISRSYVSRIEKKLLEDLKSNLC